jgi:hypothetical protein
MHVQTLRLASIACTALIVALSGCSIPDRAATGVPPVPGTAAARAAAQSTIYSNLGKGKNVYRCCIAWTIGGPRSKIGKQWIGAAFTPSQDSMATSVSLALTWSLGTDAGLTVALAPDRNGHPGKDIVAATGPANLPAFNHCCTLQTVRFGASAPLSKGVRYWVVVRTNAATTKSVDNWQNNITGAGGIISSQDGKGWGDARVGKGLPAFAVFGR